MGFHRYHQSVFTFDVIVTCLFIFCYFGLEVTNKFKCICDSIYQSSLPSMPTEIKNYLPIMMSAAQNLIYMEGISIIRCTGEFFKKVYYEHLWIILSILILLLLSSTASCRFLLFSGCYVSWCKFCFSLSAFAYVIDNDLVL